MLSIYGVKVFFLEKFIIPCQNYWTLPVLILQWEIRNMTCQKIFSLALNLTEKIYAKRFAVYKVVEEKEEEKSKILNEFFFTFVFLWLFFFFKML